MSGERAARVIDHVATWTRYGLVAVGWLVIAAVASFAFLTCLGVFDAAGPGGMGHHLGIAGHAIARGTG
jgi:hypothetical protein